jgi:gamma-glutamylcyclotransferase
MGRLMKTFRYFGYGSNMLTERLRAPNRCPGATPLGVVRVDGFRLAFSKYSNRDRSGKSTLVPDTNARVYGVVFDIPLSELDALNREEGLNRGYALHENFALTLADGSASTARVYLAEKDDVGLRPFDWYLALVLAGALQHKLPPEYVRTIAATVCEKDADAARITRQQAIEALTLAGFGDPQHVLDIKSP